MYAHFADGLTTEQLDELDEALAGTTDSPATVEDRALNAALWNNLAAQAGEKMRQQAAQS